jgi:hypothetical protein
MVKHGDAWESNTQDTAWYSTVPHYKNGTAQYIMEQHGKHSKEWYSKVSKVQHVQHGTARYHTVQHGTTQYSIVQVSTEWYSTVRYGILHYIIVCGYSMAECGQYST